MGGQPAEDDRWPPGIEQVLWEGTTGLFGPWGPRFEVAVEGGYFWVSLSQLDVRAAARDGLSARAIGRAALDAGLQLLLDPVRPWHPTASESTSAFATIPCDEMLETAAELGVELISAVALEQSDVGLGGMAEAFGALCDRAGSFGAQVQLEFVPWTNVPTLRDDWTIVSQADRPNGGLVVDPWHFFRGDPDLALLETVPSERIFSVQIDDGVLAKGPGTREQRFERLLPGLGEFDVVGALRLLYRIGGLRRAGAEVLSEAMWRLAPQESARTASRASATVLHQAIHAVGIEPTSKESI